MVPPPTGQANGAPDEVVPCLIVIAGPQMGRIYALPDGRTRIGRAADAEVGLRDGSISTYHATIERTDQGGFRVVDHESKNGTFLRGERITEATLRPGERLQVGAATVLKLDYLSKIDGAFHARLHDTETRDALTGALNRRYFDQNFESTFDLTVRYADIMSLVLFDVDGMRRINEAHGYLIGDAVLHGAATRVARRLRDEDLFIRHDKDEFAIILRRTREEGALKVAEALRQLIEQRPLCCHGVEVAATLSLGVATLARPPRFASGAEMVAAATAALERAKQAGGNRAELASGASGRS